MAHEMNPDLLERIKSAAFGLIREWLFRQALNVVPSFGHNLHLPDEGGRRAI